MEKYVSAIISLKKNTSTNDLGTCASYCLNNCRSAHDDNPRKMPPDHLPDYEEMDEDFSEDVGMEV